MRFKLKCTACSATCWVDGDVEYDTNAVNLDDKHVYEWEPDEHDPACSQSSGSGLCTCNYEAVARCEHPDFEIADEEFRDNEPEFSDIDDGYYASTEDL
jgi:hypothetical protein